LARRPINKKSAARKARSPVIEQVIAKSGAGAGHKMKPAVILVGADKGGVGRRLSHVRLPIISREKTF